MFWKRDERDAYIYDVTYQPGVLGRQICDGGEYGGSCLSCSDDRFEEVVRNWYRAHIRHAEFDGLSNLDFITRFLKGKKA